MVRTKVMGIIVGVAVLHVVLLLAMGTSGCAKDAVMAPRQALPPVPDNPTAAPAAPVTPLAPAAPAAPAAPSTPAVTAPKTDVAALPKLDLGKLPKGPAKASVSGPASGSYKVASGDTLGGIAYRHGVKAADLAAYNGLTLKSVLQVGQTLQIPPGGKLKAGSSAKKSTATVAKNSATGTKSGDSASAAVSSGAATVAGGTYVVVKGDFPAKIAKKNNVSVKDLLAANKLTEKSVLQIGQKLVIPGKGAATAATPAGAATAAPSVEDLNDVLSDLPATTPTAGATGTPSAVTPATATPGVTTAPVTPAAATPATGATGTPAAVTPVTPPAAPANANVELDPIMVDRDLPLKDFAARYGVTEDVVRRYNPNVIPADNILKYQTIIMLPQVSN